MYTQVWWRFTDGVVAEAVVVTERVDAASRRTDERIFTLVNVYDIAHHHSSAELKTTHYSDLRNMFLAAIFL